jgi:hypothetical protein
VVLNIATRSLIETVNALHLVHRRNDLDDREHLRETDKFSEKIFAKPQPFRSALEDDPATVRDERFRYDEGTPF